MATALTERPVSPVTGLSYKVGFHHTRAGRADAGRRNSRAAAIRRGMDPADYDAQVVAGRRWCLTCRKFHGEEEFGISIYQRKWRHYRCTVDLFWNRETFEDANLESLPERSTEEWPVAELVGAILATLPARSRAIIRARFGLDGEPRSLTSIANDYGLTKERIRQIEAKSIRNMRRSRHRVAAKFGIDLRDEGD